MLTFLLAEAELELMPPALQRHPDVVRRSRARRREPERLLLDQALDHAALKESGVPDWDRRGRPDIAHFWMLLALDSLVGRRGEARVLVHTRHDELVRVRPDVRLMRNQAKFAQLAEDLLRQGEVPRGDPLLTLERGWPLEKVVREEARGAKALLDVGGALARGAWFRDLVLRAPDGEATVVVGGFPKGSFRQARPAWFDHVVRVADEELTVWSAMVPVLSGLEDALLAREAEGRS